MCEKRIIQEFPAVVIGGPTGDYSVQAPITSNKYVEYLVVNIANGDAGVSKVFITGQSQEAAKTLNWVGGVKLNDDVHAVGNAFSVLASTDAPDPMSYWERVTHSQKRVFVRIDTVASNSVFVTIRFRQIEIERVPGLSTAVPHDQAHLMNIARADAVNARLGLDKEIHEGEGLNAKRP